MTPSDTLGSSTLALIYGAREMPVIRAADAVPPDRLIDTLRAELDSVRRDAFVESVDQRRRDVRGELHRQEPVRLDAKAAEGFA
jgi:hypothetical protein